jgi:phage shock protein A
MKYDNDGNAIIEASVKRTLVESVDDLAKTIASLDKNNDAFDEKVMILTGKLDQFRQRIEWLESDVEQIKDKLGMLGEK